MQVAIKFLERGAGIGRGVLREVLNHRWCRLHWSFPSRAAPCQATPAQLLTIDSLARQARTLLVPSVWAVYRS